jgi:hypothetical protein
MSVTLPTSPSPRSLTPRLVTARAELRSAFGGSTQRINRLGSRWAFEVELPPMTAANALAWTDLLVEADTGILELPEPGITIGSPGTPLVNGASQTGSSLITDGWTAGYVIPKGKWLSVSVSSLLYLYQTTASTTASGGGAATLPIRPLLRASPADNAALNVNPAKVEGFVSVSDGAMGISVARLVEGLSFTIEERR